MKKDSATRRTIDWEAVERDYRAGLKTLRQIADEQGITHGAINKRAKRDGWSRDLQAKIQAKAESLVSKAEVSKEVSKADLVTEREVIEANGEMLAGVIRGHRKDATRLRAVVQALLVKVESILSETEIFEQIGVLCLAPNEQGIDKVSELYHKVISLPGQTAMVKTLAETLKILIELERKIFKLESVGDDPVESAARGAAEGVQRAMLDFQDVKAAVVGK